MPQAQQTMLDSNLNFSLGQHLIYRIWVRTNDVVKVKIIRLRSGTLRLMPGVQDPQGQGQDP